MSRSRIGQLRYYAFSPVTELSSCFLKAKSIAKGRSKVVLSRCSGTKRSKPKKSYMRESSSRYPGLGHKCKSGAVASLQIFSKQGRNDGRVQGRSFLYQTQHSRSFPLRHTSSRGRHDDDFGLFPSVWN